MSNWHNTKEYKEWRESVLKRDNYQCQICGDKKLLTAHHINHGSYFKEQRYDLNNGITLCNQCHSHFHNSHMRSYRQKCTEYDWKQFLEEVEYFKEKFKGECNGK